MASSRPPPLHSPTPGPVYAKGWKRPVGLTLAVAVCVFFAVIFLLFARNLWMRVIASTWPTATGTVTASRIAISTDQEGYSHRYPEITYRYTVDGTSYAATERSLPGDPDRVVRDLPPRSPVTVHYNPAQPSTAFLVTGWAAIGPGAIFLLGGLALITGMLSRGIFLAVRTRASEVR